MLHLKLKMTKWKNIRWKEIIPQKNYSKNGRYGSKEQFFLCCTYYIHSKLVLHSNLLSMSKCLNCVWMYVLFMLNICLWIMLKFINIFFLLLCVLFTREKIRKNIILISSERYMKYEMPIHLSSKIYCKIILKRLKNRYYIHLGEIVWYFELQFSDNIIA